MMRWLVLAALAFFALPAQAQTKADKAAVTRIVQTAYSNFGVTGEDMIELPDIAKSARLKAGEDECTAMQAKIDAKEGDDSSFGNCSEDYDIWCQCQDTYGLSKARMKFATSFPAPGRAFVEVTFNSFAVGEEKAKPGGKPDLRWVFVKTATGWAVDDYWEYARAEDGPGDESYRGRVVRGVSEMRKTLGMPGWVEPKL